MELREGIQVETYGTEGHSKDNMDISVVKTP